MDEYHIAKLADQFRVPQQSVVVLNAELKGNDFYQGLALRALGVGLDFVLELAAERRDLGEARSDIMELQRMFPNRTPNKLAGFYLDNIRHENSVRNISDGLYGSPRFVSLSENSSDSKLKGVRLDLGFPNRESPYRSQGFREDAVVSLEEKTH